MEWKKITDLNDNFCGTIEVGWIDEDWDCINSSETITYLIDGELAIKKSDFNAEFNLKNATNIIEFKEKYEYCYYFTHPVFKGK